MKTPTPFTPTPSADTAAALKARNDYRDAQRHYLHWLRHGTMPDLISELPLYVCTMVEALAEAAVAHPELLAEEARSRVTWPVLVARHAPSGPDFGALADRIQLGADAFVSVSPRATYRWDTPLNLFLFQVIQDQCLETPDEFYFLESPEPQPRLTVHSLPWYLDEYIMPILDEVREKQGGWDGVPAVAALVRGVSAPARQRQIARRHLREALRELAGPEEAVTKPLPS